MRKIQRLAAIGAMAALTVSLAACASDEEPSTGSAATSSMPMTTTSAAPTTTTGAAGGDGVTTAADVYGPGCAQVPTSGEGSVEGMIDDPVATAASNNPLLTTLVQAVTAANLGDTLNGQEAITVFAPANPAFEQIPAADLQALLANTEQLTSVLTYHVVPQRLDADGLAEATTVETLQGGSVTIEGSGEDITINGATVLCGNVPTANATVFVIDTVLTPTG